MADRGKAVVIGGGALAIVAAALAFGGGDAKAEPAKAEPKARPLTAKEKAIALAIKFASVFQVPASLILAVISVQSGYRPTAQNPRNKRGGAWGLGQVTLTTAQDLTKRLPAIARNWWPQWNGTGPGLLDPVVNVAMTAYMLSIAWKRYKAAPDGWLIAALSYHQGLGGIARLVKAGGGKLPAKLPPNATIMRERFNRVRNGGDSVVTKAYTRERATGEVKGDLFSDNLGADPEAPKPPALPIKPDATTAKVNALAEKLVTRAQCRAALGEVAKVLRGVYPVADKTPFIARLVGLRDALRSHIDSVNNYAQRVYKDIDSNPGAPDLRNRRRTALAVLQAGDVARSVDEAVNDPELQFWPGFLRGIKIVLEGIGDAAKAVMPSWAPWAAAGIAAVGIGAIALKR